MGFEPKIFCMKVTDGEAPGSVEYPFIVIAPRFTLTQSSSAC